MLREEAEQLVQDAASKLGEHFDAVQILVSWNEDSACYLVARGCGNLYARQGMAHDFIKTDTAQITAQEVSMVIPQLHDDSEGDEEHA